MARAHTGSAAALHTILQHGRTMHDGRAPLAGKQVDVHCDWVVTPAADGSSITFNTEHDFGGQVMITRVWTGKP